MRDPRFASRPKKFEHLDTIQYEIDMLDYCFGQLVRGSFPDNASYYLSIEGFLFHYRNLCEFFSSTGDLKANKPEVWVQNRKMTGEELATIHDKGLNKKYTGQISQYLAHCTKGRAIRDRDWNIPEMYDDVKPVLEAFRKLFPVKKLPSASIQAARIAAGRLMEKLICRPSYPPPKSLV
jgi:hypothetical protein